MPWALGGSIRGPAGPTGPAGAWPALGGKVSGQNQPPSNMITSAAATLASGNMSASLLDVGPGSATYSAIAVYVGAASGNTGGATLEWRLGIYTDANGVPGTLVVDAGALTALVVGANPLPITQTLQGRYWCVCRYVASAAPSTAPTVHQITNGLALPGNTWTNDYRGHLATGQAAGALPAAWPASTPNISNVVTVGMRFV